MFMFCLLFVFLQMTIRVGIPNNPTFLVHGIVSSKNEMKPLAEYLQREGIETYNIEIGNGELSSVFMSMNEQCSILAENIKNTLGKTMTSKEKINIVAISQGGLLARCYVEKYTHLSDYPRVDLLLTMGTPHMGIYIPNSPDFYKLIVKDYWKDPFQYLEYLKTNTFLAKLNNEIMHINSSQYKNNLLMVDRFIVVWSKIDTVISPYQSALFEFYNITTAEEKKELVIVDLKTSDWYKSDNLGLMTMYNEKRFIDLQYDCQHDKFKSSECFIPILNLIS